MAGAISSSLYISQPPSPVLKSAREEPALPALLFSIISGAAGRQTGTGVSDTGGSREVLVAPFQALRQGQPWHPFPGCLAGLPGFLAGKVAFWGHPRGRSVELVVWCQPGVQVQCLLTWSDARPPARQSPRPTPSFRRQWRGCLSVCYASIDRGWGAPGPALSQLLLSPQHSSPIRQGLCL